MADILTLVTLEHTERQEAADYANTVMQRVSGPNYTGLEQDNRFFVGRLGELAVRKWANEARLIYEETVNDLGIPDEQDFLFIFYDGRSARINVKNSLHQNAAYLMQPKAQADKHTEQDIYIGCSGVDDGSRVEMRLWGGITCKQFLERASLVQRKIETLQFPLAKLPYSMTFMASQILQRERSAM